MLLAAMLSGEELPDSDETAAHRRCLTTYDGLQRLTCGDVSQALVCK